MPTWRLVVATLIVAMGFDTGQAKERGMNGLKDVIAFGVAPLFFLAAAVKVGAALRLPEGRRKLIRQGVLYGLAGLVWLLVAFCLRT